MKRRPLIAAIFLLAGAVVNVAVAWGIAAWGEVSLSKSMWEPGSEQDCEIVRRFRIFDGPIAGVMKTQWVSGLGHTGWVIQSATMIGDRSLFAVIRHTGFGWRIPAVACDVGSTNDGIKIIESNIIVRGIAVPGWITRRRNPPPPVFPLQPIWPGFAVNTIFYAAVLWLLIPGPFVLRRLIRMRRGGCVKCGYPMGESAACSECGAALPSPKVTAT